MQEKLKAKFNIKQAIKILETSEASIRDIVRVKGKRKPIYKMDTAGCGKSMFFSENELVDIYIILQMAKHGIDRKLFNEKQIITGPVKTTIDRAMAIDHIRKRIKHETM